MSYILRAIHETAWAILPAKFAALMAVAERHAAGVTLSQAEIEAATGKRPASANLGGVGVLPIYGTIFPRANLVTESSGGTSAERLAAQFRAMLADPAVAAIALDIDSPGGAVNGVDEVASEIYKARGQKPIVAIANHLAASAAYWIASAADEIVVTPSGEVGSIGVFAAHEDVSKADEYNGVKTTLISAGKYKVEGNPYGPLTEEALAAIQKRVDDYYAMFTAAVARGRGVPVSSVRNGFGEGRTVGAKEAVALGLADRVDTLDATLARMLANIKRAARTPAAELDYRQRRARAAHAGAQIDARIRPPNGPG